MSSQNFVTKDDLKTAFGDFEKRIDKKFEDFAGQIISATAKGFEETAKKADLQRVEKKVDNLEKKVDRIETDVRDIKRDVADLT
jgi:polyhydroxyalkanoate synthesis regulator phasin